MPNRVGRPAGPAESTERLRLDALRAYNVLDTPPEESFDRVTRLAARLFSVAKASVSLVDADRVWFKSRTGFEHSELPRSEAFCSGAVLSPDVLIIADAARDARYRDYRAVTKERGIRFYAGAPLLAPGGFAVGTLCILDTAPRDFSAEDARMLSDLAVLVVDQLELRRVAEQLRRSAADYRTLFVNSPIGIYRTSPEGRILMANPAILRMLDYSTLSDLQARNIESEALVDQRANWRARLEKTGEIADHESLWRARDGRPVHICESTRVVRGANGEVLYYEGWAENISLRKAAEEERRRAQDLLQEIFTTVTDLLYVYDFKGKKTIYANRPLAALLGYADEDISIFNARAEQLVHPADAARALDYAGRCCNQRDGAVAETELRLRNAQGEWRWIYTRNSVFQRGEAGEARQILGLAADVTERHRMQEQLKRQDERWELAMEANNDGLWDWDAGSGAVFHSARWKSMLGYEPAEPVDWEASLHPDDAGRVMQSIDRYLAREAPHYNEEYQIRGKDGAYRWVLARGIAQWDTDGKPLRMVGSHSDITQRKQAELVVRLQNEALALAKEKAEAAAVAKSSFLATMSHEIRTPLNGIIGMTGILADTSLTDEQQDYLRTLRASGEALLAIINDILDFSKIESGRMDLEVVDFDLWSSVEEAVSLVAPAAHARGIELAAPIDVAAPRAVRGDAARLRQILLNLLGNAVKFTQKGEVVVTVTVVTRLPDSVHLRFEVSDTGIGIPEHARLRIFDPFTQADSSTTRRFGGTGLGLAICRQLVGLMGGEIGVESRQGRGSTFWFTLTLGVGALPVSQDEDSRALHHRRVLVVDDNATNRKLLEKLLQNFGMQVVCAEDGIGALRILLESTKTEEPFDLALVDFQMPLMDGIMLTKLIRAQRQFATLPILLLSSISDHEQAAAAAEFAIHATLLKPLRRAPLLAAIRRALEGANSVEAVVPEPAAARADPEKLRGHVLLAEDNPVNQKVCGLILSKAGYTFEVVANGLEAIRAMDKGTFSAILLDCQMPEMDGFETARAIRRRGGDDSKIPIIALTANAMSGERERCLAAGMDDYLAKPIRREVLTAVLGNWIHE
ncbi:MAG: response regulator [Acidobacteriota bacterium]